MAVLEVRELNKSFGKSHIIKDLSFNINGGEILGFLGPNGSGKTTTIKMIMGFLRPDSGNIVINGVNCRKNYEEAMSKVGGIVENPEMYTYLSGRKNLEMYSRLHGNVSKERIDEVLSLVGMTGAGNEKVKKYSLGMKQRIGLALALVHRPNLLILDEPTNGLDPEGIKDLRNILKNLAHSENCAVMVSSHLLSEMELMCDRVLILDNGRVVGEKMISELDVKGVELCGYFYETSESAMALELLHEYDVKMTENGITVMLNPEEVPSITRLLATNIPITGLSKLHTSLEDEFINITKGGNRNE